LKFQHELKLRHKMLAADTVNVHKLFMMVSNNNGIGNICVNCKVGKNNTILILGFGVVVTG